MKKTYQEKIEYLSKALSQIQFALEKYKIKNDVSEYFYFAAEKKAEEVVQTAISINQDILASYYDFVSKSYYDSFIEIERLGIFSKNRINITYELLLKFVLYIHELNGTNELFLRRVGI